MSNLTDFGWSIFFEESAQEFLQQGFQAGRVAIEHRESYVVLTAEGELVAEATGRLLHTRDSPADMPKVGDWVILQKVEGDGRAIILDVLPRRTKFSRKVAGKKTDEQVIATNIDTVFLVQSLDSNFNVRRLERALVLVNESGAKGVVLLNKSDLCKQTKGRVKEAETVGEEVLSISALENKGLKKLKRLLKKGQTYAFIGSSGVGKSTIINRLVGENIQETQEVRSDSKGRHTTIRRELIVLENGACLIDTPGMRELQLWQVDEGVQETFPDIDELALSCHFSDCTHTKEIKCSVLSAVEDGSLSQKRYESYMKIQAELVSLEQRRNPTSPWELRRKMRSQGKLYKEVQKHNRKNKGRR